MIGNLRERLLEFLHKIFHFFERIRLESRFIDFLSILLVMDKCGLKIHDVFSEAVKGSLHLPQPYLEIARVYHVLSRAIPDPYTCLRRLAFLTPSPRLRHFLLSYSDILLSSGDTFKLIDYWIREEISVLKSRADSYSKLIDSIYESYMILVLGVAIYFMLPLTPINPALFSTVMFFLSILAYAFVFKLLDSIGVELDPLTRYATLATIALTPWIIAMPSRHAATVHLILLVSTGIALRYLTEPFRVLEYEVFNMLERIYSDVRLGQPIDLSFINAVKGMNVLRRVSNVLNLRFRVSEASSLIRLRGFYRRVIDLLLAPVEYTRSGVEYVGYVLEIAENVSEFRRVLSERSRVYYVYAFFTLLVVFLVIRSLSSLGLTPLLHGDRVVLKNLVYVTLVECFTLASCFKKSYWYGSYLYYISIAIIYATVFFTNL